MSKQVSKTLDSCPFFFRARLQDLVLLRIGSLQRLIVGFQGMPSILSVGGATQKGQRYTTYQESYFFERKHIPLLEFFSRQRERIVLIPSNYCSENKLSNPPNPPDQRVTFGFQKGGKGGIHD
jgi:hypothetical protein